MKYAHGKFCFYLDPNQIDSHRYNDTKAIAYANLLSRGAHFPPVSVVFDMNTHRWRTFKDGAHRIAASKLTNKLVYVICDELPEEYGKIYESFSG